MKHDKISLDVSLNGNDYSVVVEKDSNGFLHVLYYENCFLTTRLPGQVAIAFAAWQAVAVAEFISPCALAAKLHTDAAAALIIRGIERIG